MNDADLLGTLDAVRRGEFFVNLKWPVPATLWFDAARDGDKVAFHVINDRGGDDISVATEGVYDLDMARGILPNLLMEAAGQLVLVQMGIARLAMLALDEEDEDKVFAKLNDNVPPFDETKRMGDEWTRFIEEMLT